MEDIGYRRVNRDLTSDEVAVVVWLLQCAAKGPQYRALLSTVPSLRVVGEYEDGVSVDFESNSLSGGQDSTPIAIAHGKSALGVDLDVSLYGTPEAIISLVVYDWAENTTPFALPKPSELRPTQWPAD